MKASTNWFFSKKKRALKELNKPAPIKKRLSRQDIALCIKKVSSYTRNKERVALNYIKKNKDSTIIY